MGDNVSINLPAIASARRSAHRATARRAASCLAGRPASPTTTKLSLSSAASRDLSLAFTAALPNALPRALDTCPRVSATTFEGRPGRGLNAFGSKVPPRTVAAQTTDRPPRTPASASAGVFVRSPVFAGRRHSHGSFPSHATPPSRTSFPLGAFPQDGGLVCACPCLC